MAKSNKQNLHEVSLDRYASTRRGFAKGFAALAGVLSGFVFAAMALVLEATAGDTQIGIRQDLINNSLILFTVSLPALLYSTFLFIAASGVQNHKVLCFLYFDAICLISVGATQLFASLPWLFVGFNRAPELLHLSLVVAASILLLSIIQVIRVYSDVTDAINLSQHKHNAFIGSLRLPYVLLIFATIYIYGYPPPQIISISGYIIILFYIYIIVVAGRLASMDVRKLADGSDRHIADAIQRYEPVLLYTIIITLITFISISRVLLNAALLW